MNARFLLVPLLALLAACSTGPHRDQLATYTLRPPTVAVQLAGTPASWQLLVEEPVADPLLGGMRIVRGGPGELGVYRGGTWLDRAPLLLQGLLVQALENSGRLPAVARSSAALRGDFLLLTELRAFQVEADRTVVVALAAKLVRSADQGLVAARLFEQRVAVAGSGLAAIVAGFQQALDGLLPELVDWAAEGGERAWNAAGTR